MPTLRTTFACDTPNLLCSSAFSFFSHWTPRPSRWETPFTRDITIRWTEPLCSRGLFQAAIHTTWYFPAVEAPSDERVPRGNLTWLSATHTTAAAMYLPRRAGLELPVGSKAFPVVAAPGQVNLKPGRSGYFGTSIKSSFGRGSDRVTCNAVLERLSCHALDTHKSSKERSLGFKQFCRLGQRCSVTFSSFTKFSASRVQPHGQK